MDVNRSFYAKVLVSLLSGLPISLAAEECRLCTTDSTLQVGQSSPEKAPEVNILSGIAFNRAAQNGKGAGQISVNTDGGSDVHGGLINLGGYALAGTAVIHGTPGRFIRIELPERVDMTSANGGKIEIANLRTNLSLTPQLDTSGQLTFSFGGDLNVDGDMSGKFRGRITITAQYE